jgi:hypothetical protein
MGASIDAPIFSGATFQQPSQPEWVNSVDADAKGFFAGDLPFHFLPSNPLMQSRKKFY